jgi:hypothetical protein
MRLKLSQVLLAVAFIALLVAVGLIVYAATPRQTERFTEFYVLGPGGKAKDYPTSLELGNNGTVTLGITNHEGEDARYSVTIRLDNETIDTIETITLGNDASWKQNYTFTPRKVGNQTALDFYLYMNGAETPYRDLRLFINVTPTENRSALSFDGVDDYVSIADNEQLRLNGDFTLSFWMKEISFANTYPGPLYKGSSGSGGTGYIVFYDSSKHIYYKRAGETTLNLDSAQSQIDGSWHYYTLTSVRGSDDSSSPWGWYVDGELKSYGHHLLPLCQDTSRLELGHADEYANIVLDEFRIYSRALTSAEVSQIHRGTNINDTGLILYLPFDGSTNDVSGYGNNAVNHGATWTIGLSPGE